MREAIFDVLTHLEAIEGADVLDCFAGSGALGIEALSRGARSVTFVELDRKVTADIEANLAATGFGTGAGAKVVRSDALAFLAGSRHRYDLALVDPPYAFDEWPRLLSALRSEVVVLESDRSLELPEPLVRHREYRYGTTLVTVAMAPERAGTPRQGGGPPDE
ncbi:MAG: putative ribosomal methyltransferase [Acidimicrobiaceae bacterium]|nr:putative ribosomal methyltransferase [Acidimicrobiaceae bacterium]